MDHPKEPTSEECSTNAVSEWNGRRAVACWYPQMGGYAGKAVMIVGVDEDAHGTRSGCDVYVWHDGAFPFSDASADFTRSPKFLHHCSAEQFIEFGSLLQREEKAMTAAASQ